MNNSILPPNSLGSMLSADLPSSICEMEPNKASKSAKYIVSLFERSDQGFPAEFFPKKNRINAAVLGAFPSHKRNFLYDKNRDLQWLIESRLSTYEDPVAIFAINATTSYYAFELDNFSYEALDTIGRLTHAETMLAHIAGSDILFIFHEDSPACFISYRDSEAFLRDFGSISKLRRIFLQNQESWRITKLKSEKTWLKNVTKYFIPDNISDNFGQT